jgi:hypothetical protein
VKNIMCDNNRVIIIIIIRRGEQRVRIEEGKGMEGRSRAQAPPVVKSDLHHCS